MLPTPRRPLRYGHLFISFRPSEIAHCSERCHLEFGIDAVFCAWLVQVEETESRASRQVRQATR